MNEENDLAAAEGCIRGCLFTLPFWVILIVILALISLSCGVQTALPTSEPVSNALVKSVNTPQPTATEVRVEFADQCGVKPDFSAPVFTHTLGKLNIRECPSTSSPVVGILEAGTEIEAGAVIETSGTGYNCNRWRPIAYEGKARYVCAEWLGK